jgi:hypothetical protein
MTFGREGRMGVREIAAALGVVLSLIFVGVQIHQNTLAVRSATLQALSDAHRDVVMSSVLASEHSALIARVLAGETSADFSSAENTRLMGWYVVLIGHLQNTYLQREAGVVDEEVFESFGWNSPVLRSTHFDEYAERAISAAASPEFAAFFRGWMVSHPTSH